MLDICIWLTRFIDIERLYYFENFFLICSSYYERVEKQLLKDLFENLIFDRMGLVVDVKKLLAPLYLF